MNHRAKQHFIKEWLNKHAILIPFVVLALSFSLAFYLNERNQQADEKQRCQAGVDTRNVDRAQVQGFYIFVTGLLPPESEIKNLPKEDRQQVKTTKRQLEAYRTNLFSLIHPSELCAKYVTDDNVTPKQWEKQNPVPPLTPKEEAKPNG